MASTLSLSVLLIASGALALDNGFGRKPVMGFNTYNDIGCSPNQTHMYNTMNGLVDKGFLSAGYKYFQIDCGWQGYDRQQNGSITYDTTNFPDGIAPMSKAAIAKGFKWSMYTNQGVYSCDTASPAIRPGSLGYEKQDALQLAGWNVEYMKVDNCYVEPPANAPKDPRTDFASRYGVISNALQGVGIKGIAVCQWGTPFSTPSGLEGPSAWTPPLANSYRVSDDIAQGWVNVMRIMNQAIHVNLKKLSGPGRWSDMDMLEVGNPGMTAAEQTSHFAIWAMFKSTLMISTSIPFVNSATVSILQNKDLIATNQDDAGVPVTLVQRFTNDRDVFAGSLANGDRAVLLLEQSNAARTLSINFADIGIASATVKNLWTGDTKPSASSYSARVDAHGSLPLRLSNIKLAPTSKPAITWIEAESGSLHNGATAQGCSGCSSTRKVGDLQAGEGSLTLSGIRTSKETQDVLFDYLNCEVGFSFGTERGTNVRAAIISVNGGSPQNVTFPLTGYNWDKDVTKNHVVRLSGFKTSGDNTIKISGAAADTTTYAPDFDRIGVPV